MSRIATALGLSARRHGGGGVVYVRTAFVSNTGNDGTAVLNNPNFPYSNFDVAAAALLAAYSGLSTTIRLLTDITDNIGDVSGLLASGLTLRSHEATRRTLVGTVIFQGSANAGLSDLSLVNIRVASIYDTHSASNAETVGTLRGDATSLVDELNLSGSLVTDAGASGSEGTSATGSDGGAGSDGDPPSSGGDGQSIVADGEAGGNGSPGNSAWNLTLYAETGFTITTFLGAGSAGTNGGNGGNAATAVGGNGGVGGNATGTDQDGASGGHGGTAGANGGNGGNGGDGGNGSLITVNGSVTITTADYSGGAGGIKGTGGAAGSATGGVGGFGGSSTGSGNAGANGNPGGTSTLQGSDGTNGSNGVAGGLV